MKTLFEFRMNVLSKSNHPAGNTTTLISPDYLQATPRRQLETLPHNYASTNLASNRKERNNFFFAYEFGTREYTSGIWQKKAPRTSQPLRRFT